MRELADKVDEVASLCRTLGWYGFEGHYLSNAEHHRLQADKADPPQPEWKEGDYAVDGGGNVWRLKNGKWDGEYSTKELINYYGPIHKVYVSDPSEKQVAVSVDGLGLDLLQSFENWDEEALSTLNSAGLRVAKALRYQLGDLDGGDGA